WIGHGYDVDNDPNYSPYLAEQLGRSGLEEKVAIIHAIEDLEPVYSMSDVFFLSSRLDALPKVTIDAAFHELPVVCFEQESGMASLLAAEAALRPCVVLHLDVQAAARVIFEFANDEDARKRIGQATRQFAETTFDMARYVDQLDGLGHEAAAIMRQRQQDFVTLRDDPLFDKDIFLRLGTTITTREDAIRQFLAKWAAVGTSHKPAANPDFRRPCAGFHPQIYAHENLDRYEAGRVNTVANFIRNGKPEGPWQHEVITPEDERPVNVAGLRTGLHGHFHYPELATDFLHKISCNSVRCDLMLSTDTKAKADF